jgi:hypothetical protein
VEGAAIPEGFAIELKCGIVEGAAMIGIVQLAYPPWMKGAAVIGIVELAYPPCTKGAAMAEDGPTLQSCVIA